MNEITPIGGRAIAVYAKGGAIFADSRSVAEVFGKRHDHVLRDIANLLKSDISPILGTSFIPGQGADSYGRPQPFYEMTRDGFTLLAMGFTGSRAVEFKMRYIQRFNEMEAALREGAIASEARMRTIAEEVVSKAFGGMVTDQYGTVCVGYMPAWRVREEHVPDKKNGPRVAAISARLRSFLVGRSFEAPVRRERGQEGRPGRCLFSVPVVDAWLKAEGKAWIRDTIDAGRGQTVLKLVPPAEAPAPAPEQE